MEIEVKVAKLQDSLLVEKDGYRKTILGLQEKLQSSRRDFVSYVDDKPAGAADFPHISSMIADVSGILHQASRMQPGNDLLRNFISDCTMTLA